MKFMRIAIILFSLASITACASVRELTSGTKWDDNALFLIKSGQTTAKDIAYAFGSPQKEILGAGGRIWIYYYDSGKYVFEGNVARGMAEGEHYCLSIWFDPNGIVVNHDLSYSRMENPQTKQVAETIEKRGF